jgi:hypothetical protein
MSGDFLKPKGMDTDNLDRRKMVDGGGLFWNPPMYMQLGGGSSAAKFQFENNKMTLEKGGPQARGGRPL